MTVICKYCKNISYTLQECRKRMYNNNQRQNSRTKGNVGIPARTGTTPENIKTRSTRVISGESELKTEE